MKTGRTVEEVAGEAPGWSSKTGRIAPPEEERPPVPKKASDGGLSGLHRAGARHPASPRPPAGQKWLHEIKFDGYRVQAASSEDGIQPSSPEAACDWTEKFGDAIAAALRRSPRRRPSSTARSSPRARAAPRTSRLLQADLGAGRADRLVFYAFDLLHLDGHDLRPAPLVERKAALEALLRGAPETLIRYSEHFEENGELVLRHACRLSLEGVVSKDRDAPYRSGRGNDWIKSKCSERQEFVVAGYVPSTTSRHAIGSLVLGYYEKGKLVHAGRVGTGFTQKVAADLFKQLDKLAQKQSPFAKKLSADDARAAWSSSGPSSSPKSSSGPGPPTAWSAMPPSAACARIGAPEEVDQGIRRDAWSTSRARRSA